MPKSGFVIHSGIKQVFTTGPSTGNSVVNGYAINGALQGPTVNYAQSFVAGTIDTINAGSQVWKRRYVDQTQCAQDCNAPILDSVTTNCTTMVFTLVNKGVNATLSPSTRVEVSLFSNFSSILGSSSNTNTDGDNTYAFPLSSFNIVSNTPVYFRLVNICGSESIIESNPSNVIEATCVLAACCTPILNSATRVVNSSQVAVLNLAWQLGTQACSDNVDSVQLFQSTDNVNWDGGSTIAKTTPHSRTLPTVKTYYKIRSYCTSTGDYSAYSNVVEYTPIVPTIVFSPQASVSNSASSDTTSSKNQSGTVAVANGVFRVRAQSFISSNTGTGSNDGTMYCNLTIGTYNSVNTTRAGSGSSTSSGYIDLTPGTYNYTINSVAFGGNNGVFGSSGVSTQIVG